MIRFSAAATILLAAAPSAAATRTADAARVAGVNLSSTSRPVRIALRPTPTRKSRYELPRMMARNFGSVGQRQLDLLVASVQYAD